MIRYFVEHKDGGKWWSAQGWVKRQDIAYSFTFEEAASEYVRQNYHLAVHNIVNMNIDDERRPDAATDYDPFGFNRVRG